MNKFFIFIFLFILSTGALSEEYVCSGMIPSGDTVEIKTYTRSGNHFIKEHQYGKSRFEITNEMSDFIILTETYPYSDIFITLIDKKNNKFMEHYIILEDKTQIKPLMGECLVR